MSLHVISGSQATPLPEIRRIGIADVKYALVQGLDDFWAMPTHALFLVVLYPLAGLVLFRLAFHYDLIPLLFPLAAGFALIGPFAALGLYELSRRREQGLSTSWHDAFEVVRSPSIGAILVIGALLLAIFAVWIAAAQAIYVATFGHAPAAAIPDFLARVLTTPEGWTLILVGNGVGLAFAAVALTIGVVTFPLLLDRDVGAAGALVTSMRVVRTNPAIVAAWGLVVAALLVLGSLPFFLGLAIVLPVLGHATWHLYRRAVVADPNARAEFREPVESPRYAAQFPVSLFPWSREDRPRQD